ncbi:MAG: hypothetical protein ACYC4U_31780 [Pirellulaceae bacterium]
MMSRLIRSSFPWRPLVVVVALLSLSVLDPQSTRAADALKESTSLKFVPDNVAFYVAGLRMGEVYNKVASSKAVAKLKEIPAIQFGLMMAMMQWENPQIPQVNELKQALQDPQNQQLVALLQDSLSQEVFLYGGSNFGDLMLLLNEINAASNAAQVEWVAGGETEELQAIQFGKIAEVLERQGDKLKIPTMVKGAKLTDTQAALAQLKRLENLATAALAQQPQLQKNFARETIGSSEFVTLRLDGSLVPWHMLMQNFQNVDPQQLQQVTQKLTALKLVISIGVRDNYLIVSLGEDNKHLAQLGQGALLYDRSELAPLRKAADKPITRVSYASAAFMQQAGSMDRQMDQFSGMAKQFLPMAGLSDELSQELVIDVEKATTFIKANMPKPAAASGYSFLTPEGAESYGYKWSTDTALDPSKNLTILNHVGGDPIAFWAARGKTDPQHYDNLATVVTRASYYAEKVFLEKGEPQQKEAYVKLREHLLPLLTQLATVTREKLVPAFADGQSAIVLDAKSTSVSWHIQMPPAEGELPMLELAMVNSVSDAGLVREAFASYFDILQQLLDKLHELSTGDMKDLFPQEVPAIELVKPQANTKAVENATVYYYVLPAESGLDAQLAPNAGLSESVMVSSLLPRFTARLLADTPLQGEGPLANYNRPLAAAGHLDMARLLEALEPWVDYGLQGGLGMSEDDEQPEGGPMGNIPQQVHDVFDVLKCFRGLSSVIYLEGNAMVTHTQRRYQDLP